MLSLTTPFGEEHSKKGKVRIPAAILGTAVLLFSTKDAISLRIISNIIGTAIAVGSYLIFNLAYRKIREKVESEAEEA